MTHYLFALDFQLPLSGSPAEVGRLHHVRVRKPFNSLSRDHLDSPNRAVGVVRQTFNSLSRDHLIGSSSPRKSFNSILSTPSLGITRGMRG